MKWLELTLHYSCNCRCRICFVPRNTRDMAMSDKEILENLRHGRRQGAESAWISGGEPLLHPKIAPIVRSAADMGYRTIRIQTNGLGLAYEKTCRKLIDAGATEFDISLKGSDSKDHDWATRTPGAYDSVMKGLENLSALGATAFVDILLTKMTVPRLPEMIKELAVRGISGFDFWFLSIAESHSKEMKQQLPDIFETGAALVRAYEKCIKLGIRNVVNYHVPPCLTPGFEQFCVPARDLELLVCNPGGFRFMLEESPIEKGVYLDDCNGCDLREGCPGIRPDYLQVYSIDSLPRPEPKSSQEGDS